MSGSPLAQLEPLDLAGGCPRQLAHELDPPRVLVWGKAAFYVLLQLVHRDLRAGPDHDVGTGLDQPLGIGFRDDRRLE